MEVDLKLLKKVLRFLETPEGEKVTKMDHLAAIFGLPLDLFIGKCNDRRILDKVKINSIIIKSKMRDTWQFSDKPNLNLAAYRLLADREELDRLNGEASSKTMEKKDPLLEVLQPEKVWSDES